MVQHHRRDRLLSVNAVSLKQTNCGLTGTAAPNSATMRSSGLAPMLVAVLARKVGGGGGDRRASRRLDRMLRGY